MMAYLSVAAGGAIGAVMRYFFGQIVPPAKSGFPYTTLMVNIVGAVLIGVCYVLIVERLGENNYWRELIMVGILGGFTTFSTFSLEAVQLWQSGQIMLTTMYVVLSIFFCILATLIAMSLTRLL